MNDLTIRNIYGKIDMFVRNNVFNMWYPPGSRGAKDQNSSHLDAIPSRTPGHLDRIDVNLRPRARLLEDHGVGGKGVDDTLALVG